MATPGLLKTEVVVATAEVLLDLNVVEDVMLPQPEPEVHTDSNDNSDDDSSDDSDDDRELVSHLYPFMCQIHPRISLVTPASPFLE